MKLIIIVLLVLMTGCFLPKNIELGQRKVKAVPIETTQHTERIKQLTSVVKDSVSFSKNKINEIQGTNEDLTVINKELTQADDGLTMIQYHLGFPASSLVHTNYKAVESLITQIKRDENKYEKKMEDYKEDVKEIAGKKVEGTGFIQLGYFTYLGLVVGFFVLVWLAYKIYKIFNPTVSIVGNVVSLPLSFLKSGFASTVNGLEHFKTELENKISNSEEIKELLRKNLQIEQDKDVQDKLKELTKK